VSRTRRCKRRRNGRPQVRGRRTACERRDDDGKRKHQSFHGCPLPWLDHATQSTTPAARQQVETRACARAGGRNAEAVAARSHGATPSAAWRERATRRCRSSTREVTPLPRPYTEVRGSDDNVWSDRISSSTQLRNALIFLLSACDWGCTR